MLNQNCSAERVARFLTWVQEKAGFWHLICTPGDERLTLGMMRTLIQMLHDDGLDELIFVLLMVHRDAAVMDRFSSYALLSQLIEHWEEDHEKIVGDFVEHFE